MCPFLTIRHNHTSKIIYENCISKQFKEQGVWASCVDENELWTLQCRLGMIIMYIVIVKWTNHFVEAGDNIVHYVPFIIPNLYCSAHDSFVSMHEVHRPNSTFAFFCVCSLWHWRLANFLQSQPYLLESRSTKTLIEIPKHLPDTFKEYRSTPLGGKGDLPLHKTHEGVHEVPAQSLISL